MQSEIDELCETLDPADWEPVRALSHSIVDEAVDYLRGVRDQPVWREIPAEVRARYREGPPDGPSALRDVYGELTETLMPYPMGNIHPRFWAWYMGSSNYTGALGDFLAAVLGSNLGGGNHAAALMDSQVADWLRQMIGLPEGSGATLVSGGTMANIVGLTVARGVKAAEAGVDVREEGVAAIERPLRFYASDQAHSCHQKAVEVLGLGRRALTLLPTDDALRLDLDALAEAIARDRAAGLAPACVIATAGTVNTGAIDDLPAIADLCARERLWFHVDGCIGALLAIAPRHAHLVAGIERADSLALDPHKWLHAPFEVGCALVRDRTTHRNTFALSPDYLQTQERGVAAAEMLYDYGLQTSRGFRALKVWMALKEHGVAKFGRLIDQTVHLARRLVARIEATERLELTAPAPINIVCFRYDPGGCDEAALKALNIEIMLRLQESGTATVSDTTVQGRHCLRAALPNHRTRPEDLDLLVAEVQRLGDSLADAVPAAVNQN